MNPLRRKGSPPSTRRLIVWRRSLSLFRRLRRAEAEAPLLSPPRMAPGTRVYAFGDVHGRADLLTKLRDAIAGDIRRQPPQKTTVIGLGDYIDRGPDPRGVVDLLISGFGNA